MSQLSPLQTAIDHALSSDRPGLLKRLRGLQSRERQGQPIDQGLPKLSAAIEQSVAARLKRFESRPEITYPEELPVSGKRAEIAAAISEHQVVVIAGETGSGKTTQLPKICLELGRGSAGLIGHTQPRRLAARSVAQRIAEELKSELGSHVGYKVRFTDRTRPESYIKLMTDGILLAESQRDPLLCAYDTLIVDEAHERSLNIDFLLGFLKQLLPKRPDLKLIITSATINTEGFARYFSGAPIIEVSGRTYPVELRYRPILAEDEDDRDRDLPQAILDAVDEAARHDPLGDILVFLPGEREIREVDRVLTKAGLRNTEVLPLYSRLSNAEQDRVFKAHRGRRIVLATNVAETSLTVPGIRFVIDSGLARISRYSHRTKVQRLPIESISQASANQRAGRCGRVAPGVCFRLYAEEDFDARPQYTDPEIRRTNLASVILQMSLMRLGDVADFPFMDPPDSRYISDGYRLLQELQAVDHNREITELGRTLARLPLDPRLARMLLAAEQENCLDELLIITSALSVQDPRGRPQEMQQKADALHGEFNDKERRSDFLAWVNLWRWYHEQARHLSQSKLRKLCHDRLLSYVRLREWHDIHGQLLSLAKELNLSVNAEPAANDAIHRALLPGLLSHVGLKTEEEKQYLGARGLKLQLFPGSALYKKPPKWIVAAELVETSRLYARTAAAIDPAWLEPVAGHLTKRHHAEPHWEKRAGRVVAFESVTLFGLPVVTRRKVDFGPIDPKASHEIFIRGALVAGELTTRGAFLQHNLDLIAEVETLEAKARRRDVLVDDEVLYQFYAARVPEQVRDARHFEKWRKEAERAEPKLLFLDLDTLMQQEAAVSAADFPDHLDNNGLSLPLEYHFDPRNQQADGITLQVPVAALAQIDERRCDWLVPGLIGEKVTALIRSLPKQLRKNFVPATNFADAALQGLEFAKGDLREALGRQLQRMTGVQVPLDAWQPDALPPHLRMKYAVLDERGKPLLLQDDLQAARDQLAGKVKKSFKQQRLGSELERDGLTEWDLDALPAQVEEQRDGLTLRGYPCLDDAGDGSVAIRVLPDLEEAARRHRAGVRQLLRLALADKLKYLRKSLPGLKSMCLHYAPHGPCEALKDDLLQAALDHCCLQKPLPRDRAAFSARVEHGRNQLVQDASAIGQHVAAALAAHHQLARQLKQIKPFQLDTAKAIATQLDTLIGPGFASRIPPHWLDRLPVWLDAARIRLEKCGRNPQRDRQNAVDVAKLEEQWRQLAGERPPERLDPALIEARWLIEELRVSLFAQELKTRERVSVKRLGEVLEAVRRYR